MRGISRTRSPREEDRRILKMSFLEHGLTLRAYCLMPIEHDGANPIPDQAQSLRIVGLGGFPEVTVC
jgi:hypothetical protein